MNRAKIDQHLAALKRQKMAASPFGFYRGSGAEFYGAWLSPLLQIKAPLVWLNGDLHLENFGTYRGDNRLTYFDVGDFDDSCRGPATIDLLRFLTGIILAARDMKIGPAEGQELARLALMRYRAALADGKARWLERRIAKGAIGDLLRELEGRSQIEFLEKRTEVRKGGRRLRFDTGKALKLGAEEARRVTQAIRRFAANRAEPGFFRVLDVAQRAAGLGALGRPRYVAIIAGNGGLQGQALIDLKSQPGSILAPLLAKRGIRQPRWANEARRVVEVEYRLQAAAPAFLTEIMIGRRPYTFRELQPDQDKLEAKHLAGDAGRRAQAVGEMAELIAWAQLRAGGWQGSATIDELRAFGRAGDWTRPLLALAVKAAQAGEAAWASGAAESVGRKSD